MSISLRQRMHPDLQLAGLPDGTQGTPYIQSPVNRAVKRVADWLQAIKANLPVRRAQRTVAADTI
jgi:hypothetical protein